MLHAKNISSSAIERIMYDTRTRVLTIIFRSGRGYDYDGVPPEIYNALQAAVSAGHYFNKFIKPNYPQRYATGTKIQKI